MFRARNHILIFFFAFIFYSTFACYFLVFNHEFPSKESQSTKRSEVAIHVNTKDVVIPTGPITRARAKRMKEQLNILVRVVREAKEGSSVFEDGSGYVTLLQLEDQVP